MNMEQDQYTELKVLMERVSVGLENVEDKIEELKNDIVPNGKERVKSLEKEVKALAKFKNGLAAIGALIVGLIPFSESFANLMEKITG